MPLVQNVGRRWDRFRQLVGHGELFVLQVVSDELSAILVVVELRERQLGRPDRRADELTLSALISRGQEQLTSWIIDNLELALVGRYMLKNKLLFGSILSVAARDAIVALKRRRRNSRINTRAIKSDFLALTDQ